MNRNSNFKLIMISMSLFLALQGESLIARSEDAFGGMQYEQVFDQTAIYKKYRTLMRKLGCAENVFASEYKVVLGSKKLSARALEDILDPVLPFDPIKDAKELAAFEKECMDKLNNARRMSLLMPSAASLSNLAFLALLSGSFYLTKDHLLPYAKDHLFPSVKNAFPAVANWFAPKAPVDQDPARIVYAPERSYDDTILSGIWGSLGFFTSIAGAGYNLMYWPDNSLESSENHFAKNKCYIPHALWKKIEKEFMAAREDVYHRELHTQFIDFAVGFTVYKPRQSMKFKDGMSVADVKAELARRIDDFFAAYKNSLDVNYIKINVSKFVDALAYDSIAGVAQAPRYLYLYGSGGIGKTHFVQTLSGWIKELIPNAVHSEDVIIESPEDLEGSQRKPGAMLKALRNQLIENKRGSVIMIDEATWLNSGSMISSAKRLFNGDRSKLVTSYFGSTIDGSDVSLSMPPMLIFVASNEEIQDPALASRFDTVYYPAPAEQNLVEYAITVAQNSHVLQEAHCPVHKELIAAWVHGLEPANLNFRYIAGNVEAVSLVVHNQLMQQHKLMQQQSLQN